MTAGRGCLFHVSFKALSETAGRSTGVGSWSGRFVVNLTGTCGWGRCCAQIVWRGLMSRLFRLPEPPVALFVDYPIGGWRDITWINKPWFPLIWIIIGESDRLIMKVNVLVMLQGFQKFWTLVNEVGLLLDRQCSWLHGHAETGVDWSSVEQFTRWR